MRLKNRLLATATSLALVTGMGLVAAGPVAAGGTNTKSDQGVTVKLKVTDIKNKTGVVKKSEWITVKVDVPAPVVVGSYEYPVKWSGTITITGNKSVSGPSGKRTIFIPTTTGSNTFIVPVEFEKTRKSKGFVSGRYVASGGYKVTAEITARNGVSDAALGVDTTVTTKSKGAIQNKITTTKPKASSSKVKKNSRVTLSGNVKYQKATPKVYYKWANAKKGTKLVLEFKATKAKKWAKVKNLKLGKSGNWKTKTKVKRAGSYRVVVKATTHYQKKASKAAKVSVR